MFNLFLLIILLSAVAHTCQSSLSNVSIHKCLSIFSMVISHCQFSWMFYSFSSSSRLNSCWPYLPIFTAQCFNSFLEKSLTGLPLANVVAEIKLGNWKDYTFVLESMHRLLSLFIECLMDWHLAGAIDKCHLTHWVFFVQLWLSLVYCMQYFLIDSWRAWNKPSK